MAWIELHQEFREHPKIDQLAEMLEVNPAQVRGHIIGLWCWAIQYAQDGDLSRFSSRQISKAADWDGDADLFLKALKTCTWLNEDGRIHDWEEMGLRLLRSMRERQRKSRKQDDVTVTPQSRDSSVTEVCPSRPTDLTDPTDPTDLADQEKLVVDAPRRDQAKNLGELRDADFVLRLHDKEFKGWIAAQSRAIAGENESRRNGSRFLWDTHKGMNFESQMRALIYKLPDEEKLRILRESYRILHEKLNWPDYVELGIRHVLIASRKSRVASPFELTMHMLRRPGEIISSRSDGLLAGVDMRETGRAMGAMP
jgi:hypothetical protein